MPKLGHELSHREQLYQASSVKSNQKNVSKSSMLKSFWISVKAEKRRFQVLRK